MIVYWDPENGSDDNPGTADAPVATIKKAVQTAGNGGEIRCVGKPLISLGKATWTDYSAVVEFDTTPEIGPEDLIVPAGGYPHAVKNIDGTSVELYSPAWLNGTPNTQWYVDTYLVQQIKLPARQDGVYGYTDLTYSFGWDLETETQPDNWVTCMSNGGVDFVYYIAQLHGKGATKIEANGRLIGYCIDYDNGGRGIFEFSELYGEIVGELIGVRNVRTDCIAKFGRNTNVRADAIIGINTGATVGFDQGLVRIKHVIGAHAIAVVYGGYGGRLYITNYIGRTYDWEARSSWAGRGQYIEIKNFDWRNGSVYLYGQFGTLYKLENVVNVVPGSTSTPTEIAGPTSAWRIQRMDGLVEKVDAGRSGGLCLRFDPSNKILPVDCPIVITDVESGNLTISFYCRYTGTSAPNCWFEYEDAKVEFRPVRSDDWSGVEQMQVVLPVNDSDTNIRIFLCVTDNQEADALVYIDEISITDGTNTWLVDFNLNSFGLIAQPVKRPIYLQDITVEVDQEW